MSVKKPLVGASQGEISLQEVKINVQINAIIKVVFFIFLLKWLLSNLQLLIVFKPKNTGLLIKI